ncbi:DNA cytosine methyltransferase [Glutamicibacter halophytocola]|uniref:Cytosine-specific methyltransferase n=1 Tax=Glutamicibacter halophytocola TaxID=1933880 RepID=A0AA95BQY9_9MICC|nr:DNA cytosine methyltransferase [Glutamicibacter halophytocola]UUX58709.1 DNA cytosine methyltransferase [Glutamicibacter halophytocola]
MTSQTFRMGELFSGPGGMALGAKLAAGSVEGITLRHMWANDYDLDTCETYKKNILEPAYGQNAKLVKSADDVPSYGGGVVHQNVHELDIDSLGEIDGFAFGFPCNDYSLVGEWKGLKGTYGPLYSYGVAVLASKQPKWFVAENVSGLSGANEGQAFKQILEHLQSPAEGLTYKLVPHLYSFDEYGVPQRRKRIVIVGIRDDQDVDFQVPSPELYKDFDVSAKTALTVPPLAVTAPNHDFARQTQRVIERLSYLRPGENAFSPRALAVMPKHLHINTKTTISSTYKRLEPNKPSYTVTGAGGGGSHMYHWVLDRALTNREKARLQSFPDDFTFVGKKESVRKQVGMAVPVQGAEAIFTALFRTFAGIPYPFVNSNIELGKILSLTTK